MSSNTDGWLYGAAKRILGTPRSPFLCRRQEGFCAAPLQEHCRVKLFGYFDFVRLQSGGCCDKLLKVYFV